jgi:hypothetical protein
VIVIFEMKMADDHRMKGDFTFFDTTDKVIAQITGYEAVMI